MIGNNEFISFMKECKPDELRINKTAIDIAWTAALSGKRAAGPTPLQLWRHELWEVLVRLSTEIQKDTDLQLSEALEKLINQILANYKLHPWQDFRDEMLWTHAVDCFYKANSKSLDFLYETIFKNQEVKDPIEYITDLAFDKAGLGVSIQEVRFCFGMSKMTVKDEVVHKHEYDTLR